MFENNRKQNATTITITRTIYNIYYGKFVNRRNKRANKIGEIKIYTEKNFL